MVVLDGLTDAVCSVPQKMAKGDRMAIERNEPIRLHDKGTLAAVRRWIATHHDGIAEWLKNVRRQYQVDRANVAENHRVAALLLQDAREGKPARIGVLDVGGATLEDVTAWSTWQDTSASHRGSGLQEEETQGNGGKAYMFRLFAGPARVLGIRGRRRNCKGFDGELGTVERGTPGWMPSLVAGRDVEISSFEAELRQALEPCGLTIASPAHCGAPLRLAKVSHWLRVNPRSGFIRHRSMLMSSWRKPCGTSNLLSVLNKSK